MISRAVVDYIRAPGDPTRRLAIEPILEAVVRRAQYRSVSIVDPGGPPLVGVPAAARPLGQPAREAVARLAQAKSPTLSDPFPRIPMAGSACSPSPRCSSSPPADFSVRSPSRWTLPLSLFPLVTGWPITSRTAEALIVREQDADVLFLSPLRFRPGGVVRAAEAGSDSLIARMAIRGLQGPAEGSDYRGVPVYGTVRRIFRPALVSRGQGRQGRGHPGGRSGSLLVVGTLTLVALLLSAGVLARWSRQASRDAAEQDRLRTRLTRARGAESIALLAAGVAHDFNNLLAGIQGTAEVLRSRVPDPGLRGRVDGILEATRRADRVVQGLLSFAEQQRLQDETIGLNSLLLGQQETLAAVVGPRVSVLVVPASAEVWIRGDRDLLADALRHLAGNARDAMPDGGTFSMEVDTVAKARGTPPRMLPRQGVLPGSACGTPGWG